MALPTRGDPRRPLHLAASSCRVLGVLGLLGTTCWGLTLFALVSRVRLGPGGRGPNPFAIAMPLAMFGSVGVAYLIFAHFIRRRRFWAVVAALVVTGVMTLLALLSVVGSAVAAATSGGARPTLISIGVGVLVLVALGQLIYHLSMSFPALKLAPADEVRGFDVLPVAVVPTERPDAAAPPG